MKEEAVIGQICYVTIQNGNPNPGAIHTIRVVDITEHTVELAHIDAVGEVLLRYARPNVKFLEKRNRFKKSGNNIINMVAYFEQKTKENREARV